MMRAFNDRTREDIAASCANFTRQRVAPEYGALKRAAVAIVMARLPGPQDGTSMLLTRRAATLRAHSNQWALPGGRCDPGESVEESALRELHEELGLQLADRDVLGLLDDYPTRSGYLITPVLMWASDTSQMAPNPAEVDKIFHFDLRTVEHPDAFDFQTIPESDRSVIRFHSDYGQLHAPTAALIYQFREVINGRDTRVDQLEQPVFAWR